MSKLSPSVSRPRVITDDDDDDDNDHQKGIQWETGRVEYHEGKVLTDERKAELREAARLTEASRRASAAEEAGSESSGQSEDEDEEQAVEPPMVDPPADDAPAVLPSIEMVVEEKLTCYSGVVYGVLDEFIVHRGEPMPFDTADDMNRMLNSKSPPEWDNVYTKHVWVIRNTERVHPEGWWDGKPGAPTQDELPYETFYYINPYVTPDPDDPESVLKAECDKRHLRHLHKQVAVKLHERFNRLKRAGDPEKRKPLAPILDWCPAKSAPQADPRRERWPVYKSVVVKTAFAKRQSQARVKGTQPKKAKAANGEPVIKPPVPKGGFLKKHKAEEALHALSDDGEGSSGTQNVPSGEDGELWKDHWAGANAGFKRHRTISVANGKATHCYINGNSVHIVEH